MGLWPIARAICPMKVVQWMGVENISEHGIHAITNKDAIPGASDTLRGSLGAKGAFLSPSLGFSLPCHRVSFPVQGGYAQTGESFDVLSGAACKPADTHP